LLIFCGYPISKILYVVFLIQVSVLKILTGRPFHIPPRNELMGHIYVRPIDELGGKNLDWWL